MMDSSRPFQATRANTFHSAAATASQPLHHHQFPPPNDRSASYHNYSTPNPRSATSSPSRQYRRPPPLSYLPPSAPQSPRWDAYSSDDRSPTSPRFNHHQQAYPPPQFDLPSPRRHAPHDVRSFISDTRSEPTRPLTAKSSFPDMRASESGAMDLNFSRPRKASIRQPVSSDISYRPRPNMLPTPSEETGMMMPNHHVPPPSPWQRTRRPSASSNMSSSTYASATMSPILSEFSDHRGSGRPRTAQPPRQYYAYNPNHVEIPAPVIGGAQPWLGGDEPRSSFRSQLTASSVPGTANTERSSVLTKDSSATSLDANAEHNEDEPSIEDVMGMYEQGFDHDSDDDFIMHSQRLDEHDEVPSLPEIPNLAAEIRRSKMIFTSPAFMASVPHLAEANDDKADKRDSGKSMDSEPSLLSHSASTPSSAPQTPNIKSAKPNASSPSLTTVLEPEDPDKYPEICPPPETGPIIPELPGSRDRYGFKKETQNVSRKEYDAWDKGYSSYLDRRKKKWQAFQKEHSLMTDEPNRFPTPGPKTKRFVRKGIPPSWRGAAWFYYAGGPAILAKHSGLYAKLLHMKAKRVDVEAIERDLHRTFPDNINFKPPRTAEDPVDETDSGSDKKPEEPPIIGSLRRVLFAFSIYNHNIGYCQSLNFIAGLLLLFVDTEEQCFWLLNVITHIYLPGTHELSLEGSKVDLSVLMSEIRDTMPTVWDKIGGELEGDPTANSRPSTASGKSLRKVKSRVGRMRKDEIALSSERLPPITLCMTAWFMSCFIGTLPIETTLRVWDVFFYEGSKTLFRIALAIFKTGEDEIRSVNDPMEMFQVVQALPRRMIDANGLMEACFKRRNGFGHLSQGEIDERRQGWRDQSAAARGQPPRSKTEDPVVRKGTLFGKKRGASRTRAAEV